MHLTGTSQIPHVSLSNISDKVNISGKSYSYHKSLSLYSKIRQQKNEIELFCLLAERTIILKREDKECRYHEVFKKDKLNFPKENLHCYV